ncbi:MAG TPA: hypothetical protein VL371_13475 [Gemmataceae bacterium]|nr:hypothetical protein [Gemmataceae bacterium]
MFRTLVGPVSLLALLMAGLYTVSAQDNAYKPAPIPRETAEPPGAAPSPLVVPPGPSPVPAPSVEQMLQRLAQIKEQRRQLEQQEKELVDQLRTAIKQQTDKLKALGYELVPQPDGRLQPPADPIPQPAAPANPAIPPPVAPTPGGRLG